MFFLVILIVLLAAGAVGGAVAYRLPRRWPDFVSVPSPVDNVGRTLLIAMGFGLGLVGSFFVVAFTYQTFDLGSSYEDVLPALFIASPFTAMFVAAHTERAFRIFHNRRASRG